MYHGCRRSTGGFETRAAAPTPSAVDHAQLRPRTACNSNNIKDLAVDGAIQRRRYWYEANGKLDYAMGTFEYVRDLCDALHKQLGSLSTSASTIEVFVGAPCDNEVAVAKDRRCSEAIPAGVSLPPYTEGASVLRVTHLQPEPSSRRGPRRHPLTSRVTGSADTAPAPKGTPRNADLKAPVRTTNVNVDASVQTTPVPITVVPHAPRVPASATTRSRTVTQPPRTERDTEVSALRKSRRALAMRETAAALSLEAFRDVIVFGRENSIRSLCRAVAELLNPRQ
jgi:hypothetical protein